MELRYELASARAALRTHPQDQATLALIVDIQRDLWRLCHLLEDLSGAIDAARELVGLNDGSGASTKAKRLDGLGTLLIVRHHRTGSPADLERAVSTLGEAITAFEDSERHLPAATADHLECLTTLSTALLELFARGGHQEDIDRAVILALEAVDQARSIPEARLDEFCLRAGAALANRFEALRDDPDLLQSIGLFREALETTEIRGGAVSGRCADLARTLIIGYERWGRARDLDEAGILYRRALDSLPAGDYETASHLSGLSGVLSLRYEHYGDSADLTPAVELMAQAYELTEASDPSKQIRRGRLADVLLVRFGRFHDTADLDQAVDLLERGLTSARREHRLYGSFAVGLAGALRQRGLYKEDVVDLQAAERLLKEVSREAGGQADASLSFNLASVQSDIYLRLFDLDYFESATDGMRIVIASSPVDSPLLSRAKTFLAQLLLIHDERLEAARTPVHRAECLSLSREAALDPLLVPALGLVSAVTWAELAKEGDRLAAYDRALALLPLVSSHGLTVADSLARLRGVPPSLASDACAAFIDEGRHERAVEVLEEGRSLSVRLRMRWRADVAALRKVRSNLATAYEELLQSTDAVDSGLQVDPRGESRQMQELLSEIRRVEGFDRFGLPRTFAEIRSLAGEGIVVYLNMSLSRCDALVVSAAGVAVIPLRTTAEEIAEQAAMFSESMTVAAESREALKIVHAETDAREVAAWLWDVVVGPVLDHVGIPRADDEQNATLWPRIGWIPTGHLVLLPLQVAGHHAPYLSERIASSETVVDRVVSTQLGSIEVLATAREMSEEQTDDIRCLVVATSRPEGESPLNGVVEEVRRIVQHLGRERVTVLADDSSLVADGSSTKAVVLDALPIHNWVHFACHAAASPNAPTDSLLMLTDHKSDPLRVEDLLAARPDAPRVAFFSACSTASVSPDLAHEPVHFGIAASVAGYAHAILTLWPVRDDPEIAGAIYQEVLDSMSWPLDASLPAAVHDANRQVRRSSKNALHRWAATIHQGP